MPIGSLYMGFDQQPEWAAGCFKRKFRWKFIIPSISADGIFSLPPLKAARPSLTFKTIEAQHLNETIYFPAKPEWKPIQLSLYDMLKYDTDGTPLSNAIFSWIYRVYDSTPNNCGQWHPALGDVDDQVGMPGLKAAYAWLELYDGCGDLLERWIFEHVWPEAVDWEDLDYGDSGVVMCNVTLRYDRAYIDTEVPPGWCHVFVPTYPTVITDTCSVVPEVSITVPTSPYCTNASVISNSLVGPLNAVPQTVEPAPASLMAPQIKRKFSVRK